jgi:hypothetical protein
MEVGTYADEIKQFYLHKVLPLRDITECRGRCVNSLALVLATFAVIDNKLKTEVH